MALGTVSHHFEHSRNLGIFNVFIPPATAAAKRLAVAAVPFFFASLEPPDLKMEQKHGYGLCHALLHSFQNYDMTKKSLSILKGTKHLFLTRQGAKKWMNDQW